MIIRKHKGFTLVELLIVVVIIGILATIGIPSYRDYVRRSNRSAAKAVLLQNVQFLERSRTSSNSYALKSDGGAMDVNALPTRQAPADGDAKYDIALNNLAAGTYTLVAVPVVGGPMDDDPCGQLSINELGVRAVSGTEDVNTCWNR
jgi:type IV pilus assembly protein PilE